MTKQEIIATLQRLDVDYNLHISNLIDEIKTIFAEHDSMKLELEDASRTNKFLFEQLVK